MPTLISFLSSDEKANNHVIKLIEDSDWDNIILIKGKNISDIKTNKKIDYIDIDNNLLLPLLVSDLKQSLKDKINDTEVYINFIAGSGKEHMSLLSALLKLGLGIRLIAYTKEGVKEV